MIFKSRKLGTALFALTLASLATVAKADTTVFSTNFDSVIPTEITPGANAALAGVQGYAGLGPAGNQFGGSFLRSATANVVTLTLTGLPAHTAINLDFLFAAIDSLDGTGTFPQGDFFKVTLDGTQMFRESFANATTSQIQSYSPSSSGLVLARMTNLGFSGPNGYFTDSAYNLGADTQFGTWAHTASTATFTFQIEGPGIQPLSDESWAMDNLSVSITPVPEPESYAMFLAGLGLMGFIARRRRASL
jgi:hypothetical protein